MAILCLCIWRASFNSNTGLPEEFVPFVTLCCGLAVDADDSDGLLELGLNLEVEGSEDASNISALILYKDIAKRRNKILEVDDNLVSIISLFHFKDIAGYTMPGVFLGYLFIYRARDDLRGLG